MVETRVFFFGGGGGGRVRMFFSQMKQVNNKWNKTTEDETIQINK